jgi:invasion protein IalB
MPRKFAIYAAAGSFVVLSAAAFAQQAPAPAAPDAAAAPPAAAGQSPAQQFSINQSVGDWVVRCVQTTIKSPAPCEVMQTTVNKDTKQRISSFSMAYVPSRDAYAMQVVVPTGVALTKGLQLGTTLNAVKFNRCERDGCYVEIVVGADAVTQLQAAGKSTTIKVSSYGPEGKEIPLPVSLTGFPEALDRMKGLAKERAIALPAGAPALPAGPANGVANAAPAAAPPVAAQPARPAAPRAGR